MDADWSTPSPERERRWRAAAGWAGLGAAVLAAAALLYLGWWGWRILRAVFLPGNFRLLLHVVEVAVLGVAALEVALAFWRHGRRHGVRPFGGRRASVRRPVVAGSDPGRRGLRLDGEMVSRRHAELRPGREGALIVRDLGSTNGTWVQGEDLRETGSRELRPGEQVTLGRGGPALVCTPRSAPEIAPTRLRVALLSTLLACGLFLAWQSHRAELPESSIVVGRTAIDFEPFRSGAPVAFLFVVAAGVLGVWVASAGRPSRPVEVRLATQSIALLLVVGIVVLYGLLPMVGLRYSRAAVRALDDVGGESWTAIEEWESAGHDAEHWARSADGASPLPELEPDDAAALTRRYARGRAALRWASNLATTTGRPWPAATVFRQSLALLALVAVVGGLPLAVPRVRRWLSRFVEGLGHPVSPALLRAADRGRPVARFLRPLAYRDLLIGLLAGAVVAITLWTPLGTTLGRGKSLYLDLPGIPTLQSVELVKALFVLFMAGYFARTAPLLARAPRRRYLVPYLLAVLVTLGLTGIQADLGGLFMLGIFLGLVFVAATGQLRLVATVPLLVLPGLLLAWWLGLASIVETRLALWFSPRTHPLGEQIVQTRQLLLSSGWFGYPPESTRAARIPDIQGDMVVAAVGERYGLIGLLALCTIFFVLGASLLRAAHGAGRTGAVLLASVAALLLVQVLTQIGGVVGLMPLTGVPLPWISHGLTASTVFTLLVGLALAVALRQESAVDAPTGSRRHLRRALAFCTVALAGALVLWMAVLPREGRLGPRGEGYLWLDRARASRFDDWIDKGFFERVRDSPRVTVDRSSFTAWRESQPDGSGDPGLLALIRAAEGLRWTPEGILPRRFLVTNPNPFSDRSPPRGWILGRDETALALTDRRGRRLYPLGPAALHPVGFRGGVAAPLGLEAAVAGILRNRKASRTQSRTLRLRAFVEDIHRGPDLVSTLDAGLQRRAVELLDGRPGAVVLMDAGSGDLLVSASAPSLSPGELDVEDWRRARRDADRPLLDRALRSTDEYSPPGSVFKIVVAAAVLRHPDRLDPEAEQVCAGHDPDLRVSCAHGAVHGPLDLETALEVSCNIYFARAAVALGPEALRETARRFGLEDGRGVELLTGLEGASMTGGAISLLPPAEGPWTDHSLARVGFGQGPVSLNPVDVARLGAVVASGGRSVSPRLVRAVALGKRTEGVRTLVWSHELELPDKERALDRHVVRSLRRALVRVFDGQRGTARRLPKLWRGREGFRLGRRSPGDDWEQVAVAGKTGSAWRSDRDTTDDAWMLAWAPAEEPRLVVAVLLRNAGEGGRVAGPVALEMLREGLEEAEEER